MNDTLPYSVAAISDIHGNVAALNAVLEDLQSQPVDRLVVAGDLVLSGPRPAESLDAIRDLEIPTIYGNTDQLVFDEQHSEERLDWVREKLGTDGLSYLKGLPFEHRITPPGGRSPEDDLLIVHATPADVNGMLVLQPVPFSQRPVTPEAEARTLLGDARANLIVAGHLHYASCGVPCGQRYSIIDSVGFPYDGDHRAGYAGVRWDGQEWHVENHRLGYDYDKVAEDLRRCGAPFGELSAHRILQARFRPVT
ncbi:MAG: metallophosphoesterase family protein [Gemmatimonadota bacterium]|nr:metallophosphoesterase family protein [Gemmatimonadota bacterium]